MFSISIATFSVFILIIFSIVFLLKKLPAGGANYFLSIAFVLMVISNLSVTLLHYAHAFKPYNLLASYFPAHCVSALLIAPSLYLYICMLLGHRPVHWKKLLFHYTPALLPGSLYLLYFAAQPEPVQIHLLMNHQHAAHWMVAVLNSVFCVQTATYFIICLRKVYALRQVNYDIEVGEKLINIRWLVYFFAIALVGLGIYLLLGFLSGFSHIRLIAGLCIYAALASYLSFYFIWNSLRAVPLIPLPEIPVPLPEIPLPPPVIDEPVIQPIKTEKDNLLLIRLETEMETSRPYLDRKCNVRKVAGLLHIDPNQISNLLSNYTDLNFRNYLNKYRVECARELIRNDKAHRQTMEVIAEQSGFGSKNSFNRAFTKFTGKTPKEYQQEIEKKEKRNTKRHK